MLNNLTLFKLDPATIEGTVDAIENNLRSILFAPCLPESEVSVGWAPVDGDRGPLALNVGKQWLLEIRVERKSVPGSLLKRLVAERAQKIEDEEGRKIGRKERLEIKAELKSELLRSAFPKQSGVKLWLDLDRGILVVNSGSNTMVDTATALLNQTFEGLKLSRLELENSVTGVVAEWLRGADMPEGLELEQYCELKGGLGGDATIRYNKVSLDREDIRAQLDEGMVPTATSMCWADRISFVLTAEFGIRKIDILDLKEEATADAGDSSALLASTFFIETRELSDLIVGLVEAMGGEKVDPGF